VAPRPPLPVPAAHRLQLDPLITAEVSSTAARTGKLEMMAPAAQRFALASGAWIDPDRYERWLAGGAG
jgi:hypothetical protein